MQIAALPTDHLHSLLASLSQEGDLDLRYVISKGEICKTPGWVSCREGRNRLPLCLACRTNLAAPHACRCAAACLSEGRVSGAGREIPSGAGIVACTGEDDTFAMCEFASASS